MSISGLIQVYAYSPECDTKLLLVEAREHSPWPQYQQFNGHSNVTIRSVAIQEVWGDRMTMLLRIQRDLPEKYHVLAGTRNFLVDLDLIHVYFIALFFRFGLLLHFAPIKFCPSFPNQSTSLIFLESAPLSSSRPPHQSFISAWVQTDRFTTYLSCMDLLVVQFILAFSITPTVN